MVNEQIDNILTNLRFEPLAVASYIEDHLGFTLLFDLPKQLQHLMAEAPPAATEERGTYYFSSCVINRQYRGHERSTGGETLAG